MTVRNRHVFPAAKVALAVIKMTGGAAPVTRVLIWCSRVGPRRVFPEAPTVRPLARRRSCPGSGAWCSLRSVLWFPRSLSCRCTFRLSRPVERCPHDAGAVRGPLGAPAVRAGERLHDVQSVGPVILLAGAPR